MKKYVVVAVLAIVSCKSSTSPDAGTPAVMPQLSAQYTYDAVSSSGAHSTEYAWIDSISGQKFFVKRTSDAAGLTATAPDETYQLMPNGDLWPWSSESPSCDRIALPIESHTSQDSSIMTTPSKKNGVVVDGSVEWASQFYGMESVSTAGKIFACTKVEKSVKVIASSGDPQAPVESSTVRHIYWYSPEIQFFVKDQTVIGDSVALTRTLISFKP